MEQNEWDETENYCSRCAQDWFDFEGNTHRGTKTPSHCDECGVCTECEHLSECSEAN